MNCPNCGKELLINSDVCPECDVFEDKSREVPVKKAKKLTAFGRWFIAGALVVVLLAAALLFLGHLSRVRLHGIENGNIINNSLFYEGKNSYYYSTVEKLFCANKRFSDEEVIDSSEKGSISEIIERNNCLYYIKDKRIYQYNPKTRKIIGLDSVDKGVCSLVGYSYYDIYYSYADGLYRLSTKDLSFTKITEGTPVIGDNEVYVFDNRAAYLLDIKTLSRTPVLTVKDNVSPAFIKNERLFCYNYKESEIISIGLREGDTRVEFVAEEHNNISDVLHANLCESFLFLRGENGIYRYDMQTKETAFLEEIGYMQFILAGEGVLYTVSLDNFAFFSDLSGRVKHAVDLRE